MERLTIPLHKRPIVLRGKDSSFIERFPLTHDVPRASAIDACPGETPYEILSKFMIYQLQRELKKNGSCCV